MNKQRLLKLADHLETVNPLTFDMDSWAYQSRCGTVGCAMGHACMMPEFQAEGLRLIDNNIDLIPVFVDHDGDEYPGSVAAEQFFDLTMDDADYLFMDDYGNLVDDVSEVTPHMVANRIREMVS